jgi:glycosyltransferase involved in cell wall biosynthesis
VPRHVCFSCIELFGLGIYGGFGRATRFIGRELVKKGFRVTVVAPERKGDECPPTEMDGMEIRRFNPHTPWSALEIYRSCNADIYHSQDTWLGTYLAMKAMPDRAHVITFRDPHDPADWKIETTLSGQKKLGWWSYRLSIDNGLVRSAVNRADALYCAAEFLIPKVVQKYSLDAAPGFLPTPVMIPDSVCKSQRPTVCFVSRWDKRKKPEDFFALAERFPSVDFIAVGGSRDPERDRSLREMARNIPNLRLTGVIDQFQSDELHRIFSESWVLVNASPREGLPNTFLEAAANRCAILSYNDPDGFASHFGYHASANDLAEGLDCLLAKCEWKRAGERGHDYVSRTFGVAPAMEKHIDAYERVLHQSRS